MPSFTFTRGDTFTQFPKWVPGTDGIADMSGIAVTSGIRTRLGQYHQLEVTVAGDNLSCTVQGADTGGWELGPAVWDMKLVTGAGIVIHVPPVQMNIVRGATR